VPEMNLVTATWNGSGEFMENNTATVTHTHTVQSINIYENETVLKKR
jgi:hypothetical protein